MTKYKIEISRTAEKQFKKIDKAHQARLATAIVGLSTNPYPSGNRKLVGFDDLFRIRIGDYRIIYSVENKILVVIVLKIGHRKNIYC